MNWLRTAASAYSNVTADPQWPKYEVLETTKFYEKRHYHPFTCAAYTFTASVGDEHVMSNLWKLVKYTQGGNVDGKTLKLCLPIMVKIRPSFSNDKENTFTLMMVLDKENHAGSPPKPTVEDIYICQQPEQICYAKRFSGFAKEADWKRESTNLLELCKGLPINREELISATYDMPTKLLNRHNEVMFTEMIEKSPEETAVPVS